MTTANRPIIGPLLTTLRRAQKLRRQRGTARMFFSIIQKVLSLPLLNRCVNLAAGDVWWVSLSQERPSRRVLQSVVVRKAQPADLPALVEYFGGRWVEDRFRRGNHCWIALCQDKIGAAVWLVAGPGSFDEDFEEFRNVFQVPPGVGWTFDGKGTRLGAWGTLMAQWAPQLQEIGINELFTLIDCNNWQSADGHLSLGYRQEGILASLRVFGFRFTAFRRGGRWGRVPTNIGHLRLDGRP